MKRLNKKMEWIFEYARSSLKVLIWYFLLKIDIIPARIIRTESIERITYNLMKNREESQFSNLLINLIMLSIP